MNFRLLNDRFNRPEICPNWPFDTSVYARDIAPIAVESQGCKWDHRHRLQLGGFSLMWTCFHMPGPPVDMQALKPGKNKLMSIAHC